MTASRQQGAAQTHPHLFAKVAAQRCVDCGIPLTTGEGFEVPFIGTLGPKCVKKYAALVAVLEQVDGLEAHEYDQGSIRLAHHVIWKLRGCGIAVKVLDIAADTKRVQIMGLSKKPLAVIKSYAEIRAQFERQLQIAQVEREAAEAAAS
ncbi:hypothetical protein [Deinococcus ruber]|uniref:Uncharacterized protein n=1 Tax=Deinococcus ruber TaxID=1848197 RepID=A0A918C8Y0_9DEIO|nr:hypothetical protein [Deinococcus ruber]GGR11605.1 hypothetical protein GCM10008957_25740 [Deinococcus ruber]